MSSGIRSWLERPKEDGAGRRRMSADDALRYIHEKPAPPLVQIVKPKKSPSAKSLCAMASAGVTTARPRVLMAPLSAKKYQSSNMGILSKAGVNQYGPLEPFVIKHTVPEASQCETASGIEASVIQVIRK